MRLKAAVAREYGEEEGLRVEEEQVSPRGCCHCRYLCVPTLDSIFLFSICLTSVHDMRQGQWWQQQLKRENVVADGCEGGGSGRENIQRLAGENASVDGRYGGMKAAATSIKAGMHRGAGMIAGSMHVVVKTFPATATRAWPALLPSPLVRSRHCCCCRGLRGS